MNHVDELAELYALGSLGAEEEQHLNAHIATCDACRLRVNDAEKVVAALALEQARATMPGRAVTLHLPSQLWRFAGAFAAGLILPLLFLLPPLLRERSGAGETHAAFSALVNSHFSHVAFTRRTADAPAAKLLYARTGEWLYIVALQPKNDLTVLLRHVGAVQTVGTIRADRSDAEFFIPNPGPVDEVLLSQSGVVVASARPTFTAHRPGPAQSAAPR
ncbi:MAG: zf-HC2 domain-containing protein [Candidatus Eremiobacteraeota bacterium]|nr:zf-HC2 domain-containing protein [Candidatus Eremiobacteraeota bacterium]